MLSPIATLLVLVSVASVASGPLHSGVHGPAFVAPSLFPGLRLSPATDPSTSTQLDKARSQRGYQRSARSNGLQMAENPWDKIVKSFSNGWGFSGEGLPGGSTRPANEIRQTKRGPMSFPAPNATQRFYFRIT